MISSLDRIKVIELIDEARQAGARLEPACQVINISVRTYERWVKEGSETKDKRPYAERKPPANKLTQEEKEKIVKVCNQPDFADLTPSQIVPKLADKGEYIASESSFYRVLKEVKQNTKRVAVSNIHKKVITTHIATAPNKVWTWDITWLPAFIKGHYYKLYLIVDIFSRLIIHWEIHEKESQKHAQELVKKAVFKHGVFNTPLVLHSDNGSPMKGQDFQNLLSRLGITKSYSRPRVSNDNPFSEALFSQTK
jgi:putative transposase